MPMGAALMTRPQAGAQKFFALCLLSTGEKIILTARAMTIPEASERLHMHYDIDTVMDAWPEDIYFKHHRKGVHQPSTGAARLI